MDLKAHLFINQHLMPLELKKKHKGSDYVLICKSKGVFNSKVKPLYTAFLNSIKISEYRIGITFEKDPLAVELNN